MEVNDGLHASYAQLYPTYASHNKVQLRKTYNLGLTGIVMANIPKDYSSEVDLHKHATNIAVAYYL